MRRKKLYKKKKYEGEFLIKPNFIFYYVTIVSTFPNGFSSTNLH